MNLKKKINRLLRPFNVAMHGFGYLHALSRGAFRANEFDFFLSVFGDEKITIFDVGSNKGAMIQKFFEIFPKAMICAFEPISKLCDEAASKFPITDRLQIHNYGVSNIDGEMTLHINKNIDTSSFLLSSKTGLRSDEGVEEVHTIAVPVKKLDTAFSEIGLPFIDILKLDVQGSELNVLKGAEKLLQDQRIKIIYTEAYFVQQYVDQPLFYDIANYLRKFGYCLQDIYNPKYGQNKIAWCDAVFIKAVESQKS